MAPWPWAKAGIYGRPREVRTSVLNRPNYFLGLSHVPVLENKNKGFFARLTSTWSQDRIVRIGARGRSMFAASVQFISPSPIASKVLVGRQSTKDLTYKFDQIISLAGGARQNFQAVVRGHMHGMSPEA